MKKLITVLFVSLLSYAAFAQGFYMEMKMSSSEKGDMGVMKIYSQDGNSRSDISVNMPGGPMDMATLFLKSSPNAMYMLNVKNKSYTEMDISQNDQFKDFPQQDYEVTVLGKEKVNGFNTTHVRVTHKGSSQPEEMWTSRDVVDYSSFLTAKSKFTGRDNMNKALAAKGADGFPVRIKTSDHGAEIQMDLVKAEKRNNPASLFTLAGYSKTAGMPTGGQSRQEMLQKIQNMTPEEREKFIEQMKSQYGQ